MPRECVSLGKLPGTFIKHFIDEIGLENICRMLDAFDDRGAIGRTAYGYYDENGLRIFEGHIRGTVAQHPAGINGFGWDPIFIPDGFDITRAQLNEDDYQEIYLKIKPIEELSHFIKSL